MRPVIGKALKRSAVFVAMLVALASAGPAASSAPAAPADQATAYQSDPTHDGYIADAGLAAPLTQAWSITLPSNVSYPLIVDGTVFVTTGDTLYAINQATGSTIWSHATGGSVGLTYDRGQVFVVSTGGLLTAFDAATGSTSWSEQLPGQYSFSSPPTATNGIVYTGGAGSGGTVYAVRESDGHLLWTQSVENGDASSPAVTQDGVYVSYACQQAYAFDPVTGSLLWHHSTFCEGGGGATTVVADGTVFARDWAIGNVMLSASTGSELGPFTASQPPAVANDVAFMLKGPPSATLTAIAGAGLGANDWTFSSDPGVDTAPLVVGGLVFVGSSGDNLYALDATTGATDWSTNLGTQPTALGAANGTLIVSAGSQLRAYRTAGTITTAPSNESPPTIDGSANVKEIQAADVGIWSGLPNSYGYQWELCDAAGANCADIAGATGSSFVPPGADLGSSLRVKVTATNGVDSSMPVESAASATLGMRPGAPTSVSLSPSLQSIFGGAHATLTAQVTGTSTGTVELYGTPTGGSKTLLTFGAVGDNGAVSFDVSPAVTTTYSAVLQAGPDYASSTSQGAIVAVVQRSMRIAASRYTVTYGGKVELKITGVKGGTVDLFASHNGQAATLVRQASVASGQHSVTFTVAPKLRTVYLAERDDQTTVSNNLTVSVRPHLSVSVFTQPTSPAKIRRKGEKVLVEAARNPPLPAELMGLEIERSLSHGRWQIITQGEFQVGSDGIAVIDFVTKVPGRYRARASYTSDGDYAGGQSRWRRFRVG